MSLLGITVFGLIVIIERSQDYCFSHVQLTLDLLNYIDIRDCIDQGNIEFRGES